MGVLNVKDKWSEAAAGGSDDVRTATRVFTVLLDERDPPAARPLIAQTAPGVPRMGEGHPGDAWLRASRPQVRAVSPALYEVVVEYRVPMGGSGGEDNPLHEPARRRWTWAASPEAVDRDWEGKPIVNSAGQAFESPPMMEVVDPVLEIVRNEPTDDPVQRIQYRMAVNADAFYGASPGQARMLPIEAEEIRQGSLVFWRKTYRIHFRPGPPKEKDAAKKAWCLRLLDQGTWGKRLDGATGEDRLRIRKFVDERGIPLDRPVLLDGKGGLLGSGGNAVWLYFETGPRLPFAVFRL